MPPDLDICLEFLAFFCCSQQQSSACSCPAAAKWRHNKLDSACCCAWALSGFACKVLSLSLLGCIRNASFSQVTSCSVHRVYRRKPAEGTSFHTFILGTLFDFREKPFPSILSSQRKEYESCLISVEGGLWREHLSVGAT